MFNLPISDTFGVRVAGYSLDRDGYIDNLAHGQTDANGNTLAGIDDDLDGRDHWAVRATASWQFSDNGDVWVQYSKFKEDSDRARITNQICEKNTLPVQGCKPNGFGFDNPHLGTTTGGLFGAFFGALPYGATGGNDDPLVHYDYPRPDGIGFRAMHTDFEPILEYDEDIWSMGLTYEFQNFTVGVLGAYQETDYLTRMDYNMNVGPTMRTALTAAPTSFVALLGLTEYPTSEPAGRAGEEWTNPNCNYEDGTSGVPGGCIADVDRSRVFAFDQGDRDGEYWTAEVKLDTQFEGPFNFLVGANAYDSGASSDYYVTANTLDLLGTVLGAYPGMFNSTNAPDRDGVTSDGYAFFGQVYYDLTDTLKLTAGIRHNKDDKFVADTNPFLDASYICGLVEQLTGACPLDNPGEYSRESAFANGADAYNAARAELYGATDLFEAAMGTAPRSAERLAAARAIPKVPQPGERRALTGSPDSFTWKETTLRFGLDWQFSNDSLLYAFFTTGYKPGGFNPPVSEAFQGDISFDFEPEKVNSFEVGSKNIFMDGALKLNGNVFYYDYQGLQITRIANNSSINDNVDAEIWGAELESEWRPEAVPGLSLNAAYSYLNAEVTDGFSVDPTNRTASDPEWITLENWVPGPTAGINYVARQSDLTPAVVQGLIGAGAALPLPGTLYENGIPAYIDRGAAAAFGVQVSDGLEQDLNGNALPNSPEHTLNIGAAYAWEVNALRGRLIARLDWYWQGDMYAREFNTAGDEIDSWDQWNASLIYESNDGHWSARAWVRNLEDDDNITGHYLTSDTSGFFRNYFLTEPRIYGVSLRYSMGGS